MRTGEICSDADYDSFDEFMQRMHLEENPHLLDDELADDFNDWLTSLAPDDFAYYASEWGARVPKSVAEDFRREKGLI